MPVHETDTLIIGGGITSAMLAQKLAELRPGRKITIVEAGRSIFDTQNRGRYRERAMEYGEHPWHDDYIEDQQAAGIISMTMAVGGLALHWGGACNRFSEEDLRLKSMYGLADGLADRVDRTRTLLLRSGAPAERERRAEPASRGPAVAALSAGPHPAVLQPADSEDVGREERRQVLAAANGAQPDAPQAAAARAACTTPAERCAPLARDTRRTTRSAS